MTLTPLQTLGIILAVAAGTQLTRWLPFWLFPEKKQPPRCSGIPGESPSARHDGPAGGVLPAEHLLAVGAPRSAGADRHCCGGGAPSLEAECAAVHRWGYCAVHGAGTGGVCVKKEKRCRPAEVRPAFFSAGRGFLLLGLDTGDAGGGLGKLWGVSGCINLPTPV